MKRKRLWLQLTLVIAVLAMVSIALAIIPPPPVNQDIGIYDTVTEMFAEEDCRVCHSEGVPERHHLLVPNEDYQCTDCHEVETKPDGTQGVILTRDCVVCHTVSPHHNTVDALERHCTACHGSFVDDYDDGHEIPTYDKSIVTPDTSYRVGDETTERKWGGCEACHVGDSSATPQIKENFETHHSLGSGVSDNCLWCHFDGEATDIRICEDCHGVKSLHNIQYAYDNTAGQLGYGHIGDNWDCLGCHAWFDASSAPPTGVIIPHIEAVNPARLVAGEETTLTITGSNFINTAGGTTYTSVAVLDDGTETTTLIPDSITDSEMIVTAPALEAGNYTVYALKNGSVMSNTLPVTVVPPVIVDSATILGEDTVVIRGSGFSEYDELFAEWLGVTIEHETTEGTTVTLDSDIDSWSDTTIVVTCEDAMAGDLVTVNALYGSDSAEIQESSNPQRREL